MSETKLHESFPDAQFFIELTRKVGSWPTINIRPHIMHFRRLVFSYTE